MTEPKNALTIAEAEAKQMIASEKIIAFKFIGESRRSIKITAELTGYSYSWVKKTIKKPHVLKFMDAELRKIGIVSRAVANEAIKETARIAQGDIVEILREVLDWKGEIDIQQVKRLPKRLSAAIKSVEITAERRGKGKDAYTVLRSKLVMHDKVGALALLDKMLRISQDVPEEGDDRMEDLQLMGMVIEAPSGKKDDAIDAEFEILDKETKEDESWLQIPKERVEAK